MSPTKNEPLRKGPLKIISPRAYFWNFFKLICPHFRYTWACPYRPLHIMNTFLLQTFYLILVHIFLNPIIHLSPTPVWGVHMGDFPRYVVKCRGRRIDIKVLLYNLGDVDSTVLQSCNASDISTSLLLSPVISDMLSSWFVFNEDKSRFSEPSCVKKTSH